ncbi:hypothetical protein [Curtobacterium sp. VKM Ac-1376]|uniref:hypothetical protein n=1 Tax=Curtobacterium sp. VKM Ac-1376 TaxID=123312 RepID=UPI00188A1D94|nr:hypothetical protein [Curtobacterium sp. VKM Ac-1376]MBF4616005.1 hypothetical protein [Curtobacterium sp. VKM Ac-1376]
MAAVGGHLGSLQTVVVAGIAGYLVFSAVLVVRTIGHGRNDLEAPIASGGSAPVRRRVSSVMLLSVVEVTAMAVSVAWMASM